MKEQKKRKFADEKGVTLIALIITIIVLLILAGVSISMVAGDNGILTQAVNAADSNNLAEVKSDLSLALASCQTNYFADRYGDVGTNANVADYFTTSKIKTEMGSNYSSVKGTINIGSESTLTITKTDGKVYTAVILISDVGGVTVSSIVDSGTSSGSVAGISASDVAENPTTYYGAVVSNYTVADNNLQDNLDTEGIKWKIFYADDDNIYLIASDYILSEYLPAGIDGTRPDIGGNYIYGLDLRKVCSAYSGASSIASNLTKWNSLFLATYSESTNLNMQCVSYLMDTDLWISYTNISYADYSIGGPTLEMWVESWNDMGYTTLYCDNINSYGYYVGTIGGEELVSTSVGLDTNDALYFTEHSGYWNSCNGYFISSPSSSSSDGLYRTNTRVWST